MKKTPRAARPAPLPDGVEMELVGAIDRAPPGLRDDPRVDRLAALVGTHRRPVLVGGTEVGKTALVWQLAKRIANGERPGGASAIWQVSLRTLDAHHTKDETVSVMLSRLVRAAAACETRPIVFVRDLRMLRAFDAQHALVEALMHTDANFVGEAGPTFGTWVLEDSELAAVTHTVRIDEPDRATLVEMLTRRVDATSDVTVDPSAIERVLAHTDRLLVQRGQPGKALALLEETIAETRSHGRTRVTADDVTVRACESLRLPRFMVDPATPFDPEHLAGYLRERVVGQDDAIDAIVEALARSKSGVGDPRRPLGVMLLAGPAGVGKTYLARLVAEYVFGSAQRLVRVPLSEYSEDWKVDQLFGQRGSQAVDARRGVLARQLAGKPFSVLLLDEIERAHPIAYKHLLRPLDEGCFVNGNDEEVSLRNTLVLITSSVGSEIYREVGLGFARGDAAKARAESVRKKMVDLLPWELLDRVDRLCVCSPLGGDELLEVARRELHEMLERVSVRWPAGSVEVDDAVLAYAIADRIVAPHGNGSGARAVRRALERAVLPRIVDRMLAGPYTAGTRLRLEMSTTGVTMVERADSVVAPMPVDGRPRAAEATEPVRRLTRVS